MPENLVRYGRTAKGIPRLKCKICGKSLAAGLTDQEEAAELSGSDKAALQAAIQDEDAALQAQLDANTDLKAQLDECSKLNS